MSIIPGSRGYSFPWREGKAFVRMNKVRVRDLLDIHQRVMIKPNGDALVGPGVMRILEKEGVVPGACLDLPALVICIQSHDLSVLRLRQGEAYDHYNVFCAILGRLVIGNNMFEDKTVGREKAAVAALQALQSGDVSSFNRLKNFRGLGLPFPLDLSGLDFTGLNLAGTQFSRVDLRCAKFDLEGLEHVSFESGEHNVLRTWLNGAQFVSSDGVSYTYINTEGYPDQEIRGLKQVSPGVYCAEVH